MKNQNYPCCPGENNLRVNRRRLAYSFRKWFRIYCENTTLHGFRYVTLSGSTVVESVLWFTICIAAIVFCITLMLRLWTNFSNNPTVTIIDTSNPISRMHFPGVTICNNNKVYKPRADAIAEILSSYGFDDGMSNRLFSSLMKLIRPDTIEIDNSTASLALEILGFTVEKLMYQLMQPCSALLVRCAWLGQVYDCNKIFKTVKSAEGFCCGFNYHFDALSDNGYNNSWIRNVTMDEGHTEDFNVSESLPGVQNILTVPGAGRDVGLAVALNVEGETYKSSVRPYIGATVLIHDAVDYPDIGAQAVTVKPGHVLAATVSATGIESSQQVRLIARWKRRCLFDDEIPGNEKYSYQTCIAQCMQRQLYGPCGCLPFFKASTQSHTRTCYLTDIDCILVRRRILSQIQVNLAADCQCLPECSDKEYSVVTEAVKMDDIGYESDITRGLNVTSTSFMYVYFRDGTYLKYSRQSIMGWDALLASFGGIFGLCLGGSVISMVEFLYHLVVEFFDLRKRKQEQSRKSFPPASKMFLSVPAKESLQVQKDPDTVDSRVFLVWNEKLHQRRPNQPNGMKFNW